MMKKWIGIVLAFILMFGQIPGLGIIAAEEGTPSGQIQQDASLETTTESTADTGNNSIGLTSTPTPAPEEAPQPEAGTPTPTPTEEETPDIATGSALVAASQSADVQNNTTGTATTGENSQQTQGGSGPSGPSGPEEGSIVTGDTVSITEINDAVNTTEVNSHVFYHTINIFVETNATLDLSDPESFVAGVLTGHEDEPVINVTITSVGQQAVIENTAVSTANTGNNTVVAKENGAIVTGSAYTLMSILNRVNFVMIDSVVHVVIINIFGDLIGDIILPSPPEQAPSGNCRDCPSATVEQNATVTNNVITDADTGTNSLTTKDGGTIETGNATNVVHVNNVVNTVYIGGQWFYLTINPYGQWNGNLLGWGDLSQVPGGQPLTISAQSDGVTTQGCSTCSGALTVQSDATVVNNVYSSANTGGNSVASEHGSITTGNAYNAVSIINLVNSAFIRSFGFFGVINIFGTWIGNIGDAESFAVDEPPSDESAIGGSDVSTTTGNEQETSSSGERESGGLLEITNANNVGAYVLPGDTVTFFLTVRNIGSGNVYDAVLDLDLINDGKFVGGAKYQVGRIDVGKGKKITTGLTLSTASAPGTYVARATVRGKVGPNNDLVSASADSAFIIFGTVLSGSDTLPESTTAANSSPSVMGISYDKRSEPNILKALLVLLLLLPTYLALRLAKEREQLRALFSKQLALTARLRALQIFLL